MLSTKYNYYRLAICSSNLHTKKLHSYVRIFNIFCYFERRNNIAVERMIPNSCPSKDVGSCHRLVSALPLSNYFGILEEHFQYLSFLPKFVINNVSTKSSSATRKCVALPTRIYIRRHVGLAQEYISTTVDHLKRNYKLAVTLIGTGFTQHWCNHLVKKVYLMIINNPRLDIARIITYLSLNLRCLCLLPGGSLYIQNILMSHAGILQIMRVQYRSDDS